jgi:hypothetical protein
VHWCIQNHPILKIASSFHHGLDPVPNSLAGLGHCFSQELTIISILAIREATAVWDALFTSPLQKAANVQLA